MSFIVCSLLADRLQEIIQNREEELLYLDIAKAASLIMSFESIEIFILRQIFLK